MTFQKPDIFGLVITVWGELSGLAWEDLRPMCFAKNDNWAHCKGHDDKVEVKELVELKELASMLKAGLPELKELVSMLKAGLPA